LDEAGKKHVPAKTRSKCLDLLRAPTLRPLSLVIPFFFFVHWSAMTAIRPYMVHVFEGFHVPIDPNWATVSYNLLYSYRTRHWTIWWGLYSVYLSYILNSTPCIHNDFCCSTVRRFTWWYLDTHINTHLYSEVINTFPPGSLFVYYLYNDAIWTAYAIGLSAMRLWTTDLKER
jgi:hypothetical protein